MLLTSWVGCSPRSRVRDQMHCHYSCKQQLLCVCLRQCAADLLCGIWPRAASFGLSVHVCCVCPSACGVLTCNLCKISMVSFLVHCSVQHLEFLIHKSILWWYIWKSHAMLLPLLTTEVSDCWQSWASKDSPSSVPSFSIWLDFALAGNFICTLWSRCCLWLFVRISQFCCDPWGKEGAWYEACSSPQLWWRLGYED